MNVSVSAGDLLASCPGDTIQYRTAAGTHTGDVLDVDVEPSREHAGGLAAGRCRVTVETVAGDRHVLAASFTPNWRSPVRVRGPGPGDASEAELVTDGGVSWADLNASQRDVLLATRAMERQVTGEPSGQQVREWLTDYYGEEVGNGLLYANLVTLVERGLVEKTSVDGRTNGYTTTDPARSLLTTYVARDAGGLGLAIEDPVDQAARTDGGDPR